MKKNIILILIVLICLILVIMVTGMSNKTSFKLTSADIKQNELLDNKQVYNAHGCNGKNISPQLSWSDFPEETKSFAIICHDPDAPHEHGWYHWLVINIPVSVTEIKAGGKIKDATETINDFKQNAYGGACPPIGHGIHHYNFSVYALDIEKLDLNSNTSPVEVEKLIKKHMIAYATITGLYERK